MNKQIKYVLDQFDFERVRSAMVAVNWTYKGNDNNYYIPDVKKIREVALNLLKKVAEDDSYHSICIGGFLAEKRGDFLKLSFVLEESDSEYFGCKEYSVTHRLSRLSR